MSAKARSAASFDGEAFEAAQAINGGEVVMFLPGWDSFESVKTLNFSLHIAALVFVALLALSEILAFLYAERRETLIELRDSAAAFHRDQAVDEAEKRHAAEISGLKTQLAEAKNQVAESENRIEEANREKSSRHLTEEQKQELIKALSPFRGDKVRIFYIVGDAEGKTYAEEFLYVFAQAGWDYGGGFGVNQGIFDKDPVGIEITLNATQVATGKIPRAAEVLARTLKTLGLPEQGFRSPGVSPGTIELRIGKKPPPQK
jgi:hypothetical protein